LLADSSGTFPRIAGIILNGPFPLPEPIVRLLDGFASSVPIITTDLGTYDTAVRVMSTRGRISADSRTRYDRA
ncbi:DRTGG domain-containing protein, partial [Delftia lacustris]|uniref:DRTGG domain-containing protein n=2 Tax=Bacteria TaxID=2 RepID=UPI0006403D46